MSGALEEVEIACGQDCHASFGERPLQVIYAALVEKVENDLWMEMQVSS